MVQVNGIIDERLFADRENSRIHAVFITNYWKNSLGGGIKTFLINLVNALEPNACDVIVIFREGFDPAHFKGKPGKISFVSSAYRHLCRVRPSVIHVHGNWFGLLPGVIYKKFHGGILVFTFHTEPAKSLSPPARLFFKTLLDSCDHVTFVSKRLQERIFEIDRLSFPNPAITYAGVTALTVSDEEIREFRGRFGILDDAVVLLAQGMTVHPSKADGFKVLMRALAQLRGNFPTIVILATREGKFSAELKAFASEIGVEDRIIFTGEIDNPFVALKLCDIYTHITFAEGGVSIALIEAMSMGKPIIATSVGGIPEAIDDGVNGLLVDADPSAVAEKIEYLLKNPETAQILGNNAKLKTDECFTWDKSAKVFMSLYVDHSDNIQ